MPSNTREAAHVVKVAAAYGSLAGMEGAHIPPRHRGAFHPDKQTPPVTQPADQPVDAEMSARVLHMTFGRNAELGTDS